MFSWQTLVTWVSGLAISFQRLNVFRNDLLYLKQQSEVTVAEDGTELKDDVVKPKHIVATNEAEPGDFYEASSVSTGQWQRFDESEFVLYLINTR